MNCDPLAQNWQKSVASWLLLVLSPMWKAILIASDGDVMEAELPESEVMDPATEVHIQGADGGPMRCFRRFRVSSGTKKATYIEDCARSRTNAE